MPRFDFKCVSCGNVEEHTISNHADATNKVIFPSCSKCGNAMEKLPAAPSFSIRGFSARNGYSTRGPV